MRHSQKVETFPDGTLEVYRDAGRVLGDLVIVLRFEEQSVGVNRFYQSQMSISSNRIDRLVKVPHTGKANRMDIVLVKTEDYRQYRIQRIQEKPERGVELWELESVQVAIRKG